MCGIVGGVIQGDISEYKDNLEKLLRLSGLRGRDGYGWATWSEGEGLEIKKFLEPTFDSPHLKELLLLEPGDRFIFNTRAAPVTEGGVKIENVHPHTNSKGTLALVHNGILSNDTELINEFRLNIKSGVDTEVLAHLLNIMPVEELVEIIIGGFSVCYLMQNGDFGIIRNYKTLYQCVIPGVLYLVASEKSTLEECFPKAIISEFPKESFLEITKDEIYHKRFKAKYLSFTPELDNKKALVVVSGGMDSSLVAYIAQKIFKMEVELIHFNYAHKSLGMELDACQTVAKSLGCHLEVVDLSWLGQLGTSPLTSKDIEVPLGRESSKTSLCWVPARNLVMLSLAAAYAEAKGIGYILYGSNLEEEGPAWKDNDQAAVEAFDNAFYFGTLKGVRLFNVLGRMMKRDIIALGTFLEVPFESTCSCDEPVWEPNPELKLGGKWLACGRCGCCHNRRHAFVQAGIYDPQKYAYKMIDHYDSVNDVGQTDIEEIYQKLRAPEDDKPLSLAMYNLSRSKDE